MATVVQLVKPSADPRKRLLDVAKQALRDNPRSSDAVTDQLVKALRGDAELLWTLFEPYRQAALRELLVDAGIELRRPGQPQPREETGRARSSASNPSANAGSPSRVASRPPPNFRAVSEVAQLSLLDTFHLGKRPIGDMTPAQALAWAGNRERDIRFVRLLTQNLPPHEPIRKYRTADVAEAIFKEASKDPGPTIA